MFLFLPEKKEADMPKLPKPNVQSIANLEKIPKRIKKRLQQKPIEIIMDYISKYAYSCDEAGDVTSLNL
jgi:hypothetical protein